MANGSAAVQDFPDVCPSYVVAKIHEVGHAILGHLAIDFVLLLPLPLLLASLLYLTFPTTYNIRSRTAKPS